MHCDANPELEFPLIEIQIDEKDGFSKPQEEVPA
jgi:hypothetical protein